MFISQVDYYVNNIESMLNHLIENQPVDEELAHQMRR